MAPLLPHGPEDHGPLFDAATALMHRGENGDYEALWDYGEAGEEVTAGDLMEPGELAEWIR